MGAPRLERLIATAAVALAALACAAPAAADERVDSGDLSARVGADPWSLTLQGIAADGDLREDPARGPSPLGTLGFEDATGWHHVTRIASTRRDGEAVEIVAATDDPLGRTIEVRLEPDREGVIRLDAAVAGAPGARAMGIGFGAAPEERFFGFGERSNAVDQRGGEVDNYVSDGPYQPAERPIIGAFVPPDGQGNRDDSTYFPMPWLLSSRGYGVLAGNTERSRFGLATERADGWSFEVDAATLELRFFAGPEPADVLERLTRFTGRQPDPAAPWFFGPWYQPHGDMPAIEQARALREADAPASAANTYLHYLPCGDQEGVEAEQPPRTAGFHGLGYAITTYFNPMVCTTYTRAFNPAAERGLLTKTPAGTPAVYRYSASTDDLFLVGQFDFSHPETDAYYGGLLDEAVGHGYDGWMEDFGEYTPLDSVSANGMTGAQMHNLYPVLYHRSSYRYAKTQKRPVAGFIRSGWTGVHPYAQLVWGGDPTTSFGFDGLESAVRQALSLGASGISRWGSDIGGFFSLGRKLTPELLIRWIEFGAVSPIMRTEANGVAVPSQPDRPQITDPDVLPHWRRYAKLHTQLYPYSLAADAEYRRTGLPAMRQLGLVYPEDERAAGLDDEFMYGADLLAAPVLGEGVTERSLYLPRGRWVDFWDVVRYGEGRGGYRMRGGGRLLSGGAKATVPAPLGRLPLMVRAGATIPMLPAAVDTLASYGDERGIVRLDERAGRMRLLAFPRGRSRSAMLEDEALVSRAGKRRWRLSIHGERRRSYRVEAWLGGLKRPFRPREVTVRGKPLPAKAWSYDRRAKVLKVTARLKRGAIRISG